jgi:FkbM family methyltransferase
MLFERAKILFATLWLRMLHRPGGNGFTRVGTDYGGWTIPVELVESSWVCYTAGVGEDTSFDQELLGLGCEVVAIDPTPRAIEHIAPLLAQHERLRLAPYALWSEDGSIEFFPPASSEHVSYSVVNSEASASPILVAARNLMSVATEFGHTKIDLLKVDIEGAEYSVLPSLDLGRIGVKILCVEYHNVHGVRRMVSDIARVKDQGYEVAFVRRTDVTFISKGLMR